jgi:hypothetical protein
MFCMRCSNSIANNLEWWMACHDTIKSCMSKGPKRSRQHDKQANAHDDHPPPPDHRRNGTAEGRGVTRSADNSNG